MNVMNSYLNYWYCYGFLYRSEGDKIGGKVKRNGIHKKVGGDVCRGSGSSEYRQRNSICYSDAQAQSTGGGRLFRAWVCSER